MTSHTSNRSVSLTALTSTVLPFGVLVVIAFLAAAHIQLLEPPSDLAPAKIIDWYRTLYTARVTIILLTPALCLYALPLSTPSGRNYWLLLWTCGYLAFLIHFCWAFFVFFDGDLDKVFNSPMVRSPRFNFFLTFWWSLDILLAWLVRSNLRWVRLQRTALHLVILVAFFVGSVVEGKGFATGLGIVMAAAVSFCLIWRLISKAKERNSNPAIHERGGWK